MARRYGSSYSSSCFSSYVYDGPVLAQYACTIIVLAVYLGTLIWLCVVRRRTGSGKHLIGLPYMFALAFMFIQQAIGFISFTLGACRVTTSLQESYNWNIASMVFYGLQTFLFLWVVIWTLNTMLRKQLGARTSALKIALGLDLFLLGALLLAYIVLICNIYYLSGRSLYNYSRWGMGSKWISASYVGIAFSCVCLISISGSGILALLGARSLKKKHGAGSSLMAGIAVLTLCLFVYSIVDIIQSGLAISPASIYVTQAGYTAMYWIQSFARAFAFITVIVIAKNAAWRSNMFAENDPVEQQYAYYQQEPPVYAGPGQHA